MATATKPRHMRLTEAISFGPDLESRIDEANGVIKDVKVLGKYSKNGRRYTDPVHDQCIQLAEGATVYRNHPANESNARQVEERFGVLNGLYKKNGETYARQLKLNTHSGYYKQFLWECRNNPRGIGLSINADGDGKKDRQGILDVTKLYEIYSVDVVDNPATTLTLWEQTMDDQNMVPDTTVTPDASSGGDWKEHLANAAGAVVSSLKDGSMTKEEAKAAITKLLEMIDSGKPEEAPESPSEEDQTKMMEAIQRLPFASTKWAAKAIRKYKLSERNSKRLEKASAKLPKTLLTEQFIKTLNRAEDNEVDSLIADRLVGHNPKQLPRDNDTIKLAEQTQTGNEDKPGDNKNLISSLGAELMGALK